MTDTDFLLEVLSDGKSHDHAEILRRSFAERGCGMTVHSRASDLRKRGLVVHCALSKKNGRVSSSYQLLSLHEPTAERPEVTVGSWSEGADGNQSSLPAGRASVTGQTAGADRSSSARDPQPALPPPEQLRIEEAA